jgi:hypothetical protein
MKRLLALVLFIAPPLPAQAINIRAGASDLYNSDGVSAIAYFTDHISELDLGIENGKFVWGVSDQFKFHDWEIIAGDKPIYIAQPGAGLGFVSRGLTAVKKDDKRTITIFLGMSGTLFSVPYLTTARTANLGAGIMLRQALTKHWDFTNDDIVDGGQKTAIAGVDYTSQKLMFEGAAGVLANKRYLAGQIDYHPVHYVDANAAHATYLVDGRQINVDSAGAAVTVGPASFHASTFYANNLSGQAAGGDLRIGPVDVGTDYLHSGKFPDSYFSHVTEQVTQRIHLSQFITTSAGRISVNYGGGYTSNAISFDVGYSTYFMPLLVARSPFQQALVVQIGLNIKGLSVHTGTNVLPTGGVKWSVYGNDFVYGPLASSRMPQDRSVGKYLIRGFVQDDHGVPIEGACVEIGKAIACTNEQGEFTQRETKPRSATFRVVPEDFLMPGRWEVVGGIPATVTAALDPQLLCVTIRRK